MSADSYHKKLYQSLSKEVDYWKEVDNDCVDFRYFILDRICHYIDLALDLELIDYSTENILKNLIKMNDLVLFQATLNEWYKSFSE